MFRSWPVGLIDSQRDFKPVFQLSVPQLACIIHRNWLFADLFFHVVWQALKTFLSFKLLCQASEKIHITPFCRQWKRDISSVDQSCPTLCNPMNRSTPGLPVHHQLLELIQTHVHRVSDAIQPSHPLLSPSPPALNLSQHQGLFKWVSSSHQMAKVLEFQL